MATTMGASYTPGTPSTNAYMAGYNDGIEEGKKQASRPENSFMDKVHEATERRRIFWMRMLFFWSGLAMFLFGPVIMHGLYRLWFWAGAGETGASVGAGLVGGVIMTVGVIFCVVSNVKDLYRDF